MHMHLHMHMRVTMPLSVAGLLDAGQASLPGGLPRAQPSRPMQLYVPCMRTRMPPPPFLRGIGDGMDRLFPLVISCCCQ